ncbi:MAG: hypothetical protein AAF399_28510 [Bacteroidota bacterium]
MPIFEYGTLNSIIKSSVGTVEGIPLSIGRATNPRNQGLAHWVFCRKGNERNGSALGKESMESRDDGRVGE